MKTLAECGLTYHSCHAWVYHHARTVKVSVGASGPHLNDIIEHMDRNVRYVTYVDHGGDRRRFCTR
jgi:hypothetical protein